MAPKIAVIFYSMYGHIQKLAEAEAEGLRAAGATVDIFRVPETLPENVLGMLHAPPKDSSIPDFSDIHKLTEYDAYLFGVPTRYGNMPAQWKAFWDHTGGIWMQQGLAGKFAGLFISTAGQGGGQESTALALMSTFAHHGLIYVPLGYKVANAELTDLKEVHGGSPWGAGTFAGSDGSRQPTGLELEIAKKHGKYFAEVVSKST